MQCIYQRHIGDGWKYNSTSTYSVGDLPTNNKKWQPATPWTKYLQGLHHTLWVLFWQAGLGAQMRWRNQNSLVYVRSMLLTSREERDSTLQTYPWYLTSRSCSLNSSHSLLNSVRNGRRKLLSFSFMGSYLITKHALTEVTTPLITSWQGVVLIHHAFHKSCGDPVLHIVRCDIIIDQSEWHRYTDIKLAVVVSGTLLFWGVGPAFVSCSYQTISKLT